MRELVEHTEGINRLMARFGVKFGIYKNGEFHEQLFPFDAIPRVITGEDFRILEKGLIQRVDALNLFLKDIYGEKGPGRGVAWKCLKRKEHDGFRREAADEQSSVQKKTAGGLIPSAVVHS